MALTTHERGMTEPEEEDGGIDGPARRRRIGQERGHRRFAITRRTVPYWSVPRQASSAQPEALADDIEEALAGSDSQQRPMRLKKPRPVRGGPLAHATTTPA